MTRKIFKKIMFAMRTLLHSVTGYFIPDNFISTPAILQMSETECGIAALAILFAWHGYHAPLEELREQCGTSRDGTRANTLLKVARQHGFVAAAYKMQAESIAYLQNPVIAFWNFNHYVVLHGASKQKIFINDPAVGKMRINPEEFGKAFTGVVLAISAPEKYIKKTKQLHFWSFIRNWQVGSGTELVFMITALVLSVFFNSLNSLLYNVLLDKVILTGFLVWLPWLTGIFSVSAMLFIIMTVMQKWYHFKLQAKSGMLKIMQSFRHVLHLPLLFFSLRQKSGIVAILGQTEYVVSTLVKTLTSGFMHVLVVIFSFCLMFFMDSMLAVMSLVCASFPAFTVWMIAKLNFSNERLHIHFLSRLYAFVLANFKNFETIQACSLENSTYEHLRRNLADKLAVNSIINMANSTSNAVTALFNNISLLLMICLGSLRIVDGGMTIGNFMTFYALHMYFSTTFSTLLFSLRSMQSVRAAHMRIRDILAYPADGRFQVNHPAHTSSNPAGIPLLACQHLAFYYNRDGEQTLQDINLSLRAGEHLAIIGATGSGKSTLARLLCGLYLPKSGQILVNGQDISEMDAAALAKCFAYVGQDVSLFSGTLYDNLTFGSRKPDCELIDSCIQHACLGQLVATRGLYAEVHEDGCNFSGGERQRIDIARALIQDTPVLVLDEATAALDIDTERKLLDNLKKLDKTILFVTHRLAAIQHCQQIFLLEQGKMRAQGTHHGLLRQNEYYARMSAKEPVMRS